MFVFALASLLALVGASANRDSIPAAVLLSEVRAITSFSLLPSDGEIVPVLVVRSDQPAGLRLSALHRELRFALTWLIEGAASYDRTELVRIYSTDSAAMRRALYSELLTDTTFTLPLLALAAPLLSTQGTVVTGAPAAREQVVMSDAQARAVAARFFQVEGPRGEEVLTLCAKPQRLRDRQWPADRPIEAWFYSVLRSERGRGALGIAARALNKVGAEDPPQGLEKGLWQQLESSEEFGIFLRAASDRTSRWAPLVIRD